MLLDTRDKLVTWFCERYQPLLKRMNQTIHFTDDEISHPFHGEGSVWTHTMMVMTHIHCDDTLSQYNKQVLLTVALLHDIGKPQSLRKKHFGNGEDYKYSFEGHEGLSFFDAIDILSAMEIYDDFYGKDTRILILKLISLHGTSILFEKDSEMYKLQYRFRLADKGGAIRNVDENIFAQYPIKQVSSRVQVQSDKTLVIMSGLPGAGKSHYIKNVYSGYFIISRDEEMEKYYYNHFTTQSDINHNVIYKWINRGENIFFFNQQFDEYISKMSKLHNKIIVDMTMLSFSKRRSILNRFPKHTAHSVCILAGTKIINKTNALRNQEKIGLTYDRMNTLKKKFIVPIKEEGFKTVNIVLREYCDEI